MADEFDLGMALMQDEAASESNKQYVQAQTEPSTLKRVGFRPGLNRVTSSSNPSVQKPKVPTHMKRRSSLGDGIGLQKEAAQASSLVPNTPPPERVLAAFRQSALCFAVVNFDIDQGPDLVACYPPCSFTRDEQNSIAFTSLPDHTTSSTQGAQDTGPVFATYSWKIARDPLNRSTKSTSRPSDALYGYVNFMTQQDKSLKRSYLQRSIVLITHHHHLHGIFGKLAELLAAVNKQPPDRMSLMLEVACNCIARWPSFTPGSTLELPFLDSLITAEIPLQSGSQHPETSGISLSRPIDVVLGGSPILPLSLVFAHHLSSLWSLWELIALSEPILVYGNDVPLVSAAVTWLTLLCKPIAFSGDYRSSLTIHMHDYHHFVNPNPPHRALVIGTNNPLVFSSCRHWPHFLRLSANPSSSPTAHHHQHTHHHLHHRNKPDGVFGLPQPTHKGSKGSPSFKAALENSSGLFSPHRRTIKKDHGVLKAAQELVKAGNYRAADALLLKHFFDLSEKLLSPLNRFFSSLQPLSDPLAHPAPAPTFNTQDFINQLLNNQIPLAFKRDRLASKTSPAIHFYRRWLKTPGFATWLHTRVDASNEASRARFLGELSTVDVDKFSQTQSSTQVVELLKKLEEAAREDSTGTEGERTVKLKLQAQRLRALQDSASEISSDSSQGGPL